MDKKVWNITIIEIYKHLCGLAFISRILFWPCLEKKKCLSSVTVQFSCSNDPSICNDLGLSPILNMKSFFRDHFVDYPQVQRAFTISLWMNAGYCYKHNSITGIGWIMAIYLITETVFSNQFWNLSGLILFVFEMRTKHSFKSIQAIEMVDPI